jgi:exoribonuclease R
VNQQLSDFITMLSHDVRQPLCSLVPHQTRGATFILTLPVTS